MTNGKKKSLLLIVDDERSVGRALSRILGLSVDEAMYATSALEAETILKSREVTHLICDQWFGAGQSLGTDLTVKWRGQFPSIERAIVLTGADVSTLTMPSEVDCILTKAVDPEVIIDSLDLSGK